MSGDPAVLQLFGASGLAGSAAAGQAAGVFMERVQQLQPDWYFFLLFGLISFFAWIRIYYGNIFLQTVQASTNYRMTTRMFQDNSVLQQQLDSLLYALYFLCGSFLLYLVEQKNGLFPYGLSGIRLLLFNLALLTGIFFARIVLLNLAGFLFSRVAVFREYLYNAFIFNKLLGIIILPVLLFMVYTTGWFREIFYFLAYGAVAVVITMRMVRGSLFSFRKDISKFYAILYLWALEIVPLILLWRWLEGVL